MTLRIKLMVFLRLDCITGTMAQSQKDVLVAYRRSIIESADAGDVFLDRLLTHLLANRCIQAEHIEVIKRQHVSRNRVGKLLDVLQLGGVKAFDELCNALDHFGTEHAMDLASTLRQVLKQKYIERQRCKFQFETYYQHVHYPLTVHNCVMIIIMPAFSHCWLMSSKLICFSFASGEY